MKHLNLFFHIYQPPVQTVDMLSRIVEESYRPLTAQFLKFPALRFTLNINLSLAELLRDHGFTDVLEAIRSASEQGILELTTTGAYHPIFPLIPEDEVRRQLDLNLQGMTRLLGAAFHPRGVFPPEMALDGNTAVLFNSLGFDWTITDDSCLAAYAEPAPYDKIYSSEGLAVFLRSNLWTNKFANFAGQWRNGRDAANELEAGLGQWIGEQDGYLIIALDGETFGHHHRQLGGSFLAEFFQALGEKSRDLQLTPLSTINGLFKHVRHFIPPGSWSSDQKDVAARDYFSWWKSNRNPIHELQWELTDFVLRKVRRLDDTQLNAEMDQAIYSCQYWWACFWKFNPGEIYRGAFNMMRLLQRAAEMLGDTNEEIKVGEDIFRELVTEIEMKRNQWPAPQASSRKKRRHWET